MARRVEDGVIYLDMQESARILQGALNAAFKEYGRNHLKVSIVEEGQGKDLAVTWTGKPDKIDVFKVTGYYESVRYDEVVGENVVKGFMSEAGDVYIGAYNIHLRHNLASGGSRNSVNTQEEDEPVEPIYLEMGEAARIVQAELDKAFSGYPAGHIKVRVHNTHMRVLDVEWTGDPKPYDVLRVTVKFEGMRYDDEAGEEVLKPFFDKNGQGYVGAYTIRLKQTPSTGESGKEAGKKSAGAGSTTNKGSSAGVPKMGGRTMRPKYHYESATETAKKVRQALRLAFKEYPTRHFSVKTSNSGSLTVSWKGKPDKKEVEPVAKAYQSATFDGMQDLETLVGYTWTDGHTYIGAKYVFLNHTPVKEEEVVEQAVTEEDLVAAVAEVEEAPAEPFVTITMSNSYGYEVGTFYSFEDVSACLSAEWQKRFNESIKLRAIDEKETGLLIAADMSTPKTALISRLGLKFDTIGILRALDRTLEYGNHSYIPKIGLNKPGKWKSLAFMIGGLEYLPDAIQVYEGKKPLTHFYSLRDFNQWFNKELNKHYEDTKLKLTISVENGEFKAVVTGNDPYTRDYLAGDGIMLDGGLRMVNGLLYNMGYRAKIGGLIYGQRGSSGEKKSTKSIEAEFNQIVASEVASYRSKGKFPRIFEYTSVLRRFEESIRNNELTKREFMRAAVKGSEDVKKAIVTKAIAEMVKYNEAELYKGIKATIDDTVIGYQKKFGNELANEFVKTIGTKQQVLSKLNRLKPKKKVTLTELVKAWVDAEFKAFKVDYEAKQQQQASTGAAFSEDDIAEVAAVEVVVTRTDLVVVKRLCTEVTGEKMAEGYNVSVAELMRLVRMQGLKESKEIAEGDYGLFEMYAKAYLAALVDDNFEKLETSLQHFDPRNLKSKEMIDVLQHNVVRLVFTKADQSTRVMMATRNKKVIERHMALHSPEKIETHLEKEMHSINNPQDVQAQIARDYIRVYDLGKGEFRTFKPSKILRHDITTDIGAWLEFPVSDAGWFNVLMFGEHPANYYKNDRLAKPATSGTMEKQVWEQRADDVLAKIFNPDGVNEAAAGVEGTAPAENTQEAQDKRYKLGMHLIGEYLKQIEGIDYGDDFKKLTAMLRTIPNGLNKLQRMTERGWEAKVMNRVDAQSIYIMQVYDNLFAVHPHFLVNLVSGKVYADKTGTLRLGRPAPSEVDDVIKAQMDRVAEVINGVRKQIRQNAPEKEADMKRMARLKEYLELHADVLSSKGIRARFVKASNGLVTAEFMHRGVRINASPKVIAVKIGDGETKVIFKRERHTSTLTEMTAAIGSLTLSKEPVIQDYFTLVRYILFLTFDLRKKKLD